MSSYRTLDITLRTIRWHLYEPHRIIYHIISGIWRKTRWKTAIVWSLRDRSGLRASSLMASNMPFFAPTVQALALVTFLVVMAWLGYFERIGHLWPLCLPRSHLGGLLVERNGWDLSLVESGGVLLRFMVGALWECGIFGLQIVGGFTLLAVGLHHSTEFWMRSLVQAMFDQRTSNQNQADQVIESPNCGLIAVHPNTKEAISLGTHSDSKLLKAIRRLGRSGQALFQPPT